MRCILEIVTLNKVKLVEIFYIWDQRQCETNISNHIKNDDTCTLFKLINDITPN